ncbi:putative RNA recognition motif domain, PWI domain, RNA-binding domain superfamily [Helianthus annuus]|nr:putative RNA recognition motif domain, PWI domain, RNA-binding domain superfamily [Helianthus annuus]
MISKHAKFTLIEVYKIKTRAPKPKILGIFLLHTQFSFISFMAISTNSPEKTTADHQTSAADNPNPPKPDLPDSSTAPPSSIPATTTAPLNPNPSLNISQPPAVAPPPPPQIQSFAPPSHPNFRPVPLPTAAHFSPVPNPSYQNHGVQGQIPVQVQPPGVMVQPPASGAMPSVPQMMPPHYGQPGQQPMRMYAPMPNGYQMAVPPGAMNPPGIIRYAPPTYPQMLRPVYPQRPPGAVGVIPTLQRPPVMAMRGPVIPTIVRPPVNLAIAQTEKPMTTIYVGKIASTVDNDFMLSLLQLCGPVKSWKRVPDPTTGALKGFGFCEFESVEGVLRALRLLSKLSIDGQELMLNFDKATKEYLKRFVEKKKENSKKATDTEGDAGKEEKTASPKASVDESKEDDINNNNEANKENDDYATFGLVTNEDKEADKEASEKLSGMIEERLKNKPLPPPPPPPQTAPDAGGNSTSEHPAKSRDGGDTDADGARTEDKKDEEMTSKTNENEKLETSSPDRNSKKEEREREYKIREEERRYRGRLKEWETREKEKERARKLEREREKDREQDRKYEIMDQENDDSYSKKRKYRNSGEEREERKRRLREKEEDMEDKVKELEEIAEAKRKEEEEREKQKEQQKHALEILSGNNNNNTTTNGIDNAMVIDGSLLESRNKAFAQPSTDVEMQHGNETGKITQNGTSDDSETRQNNTLGPKKLGFGLVGSGKRTTVPSLFHEEDEDAQKDKKMRPLVPIDYSTEELQAVRETTPVPPSSNLAAAAEFAKRIGERPDSDRDRSRRAHDRSGHRDRDHETNRARDETREKEKAKTPDNKKLLDAKQLIDTIPKTKDELFSYPINWVVYDKNGLHERMRPWISKKITEFLGEEETTLVDYIVSSTQEHVTADEMLDRLQSILDDEAEMFVLKMWRMLIFEIKKVETGLAGRSKA